MILSTAYRICGPCGHLTKHLITLDVARCMGCSTTRNPGVDEGHCANCGDSLAGSPSDDFCNVTCQEQWGKARTDHPDEVLGNQPVTGWRTAARIRDIEEAA